MTSPGGQDLLRAATVALEVPAPAANEPTRATGFLVAPGIVATCAHVLGRTRENLPARVAGRLMAANRPIELETVPEWYLRQGTYGLDLAFLRVSGPCEAPHVLLSPAITIGDPMWAYGHPGGQFRAGQSAGFTYQGPSLLLDLESQRELFRVTGTPVGGGYSGSPVLNLRTGAVCGMLCLSDEVGSAHMVPAADIIAGCPAVRNVQDSPGAANLRWLSALSDEQISAGGWLFPGPRLRAYLDKAIRAAQDHPYPGVVPGITPPPLTAVYVHQQADTRVPTDGERSEQLAADLERRPAEEILDQEEDCILIGGPGAGKSSLLRTALIARARRWQRGEAAAEIPVHVLASDLIEARPLPDAIAAGVTANLSGVGIVKAWTAGFFAELEVDQPSQAARNFVRELGRTHLADPARTPLMATILCQLFAMNPGRPLPAGRSGAYAEFVDLLRSRQYADNTSGIYAQMQATLGPYGPDATSPAAALLTAAMDLIARLALARQDGEDRPALDLLAAWTDGSHPRHVPGAKWRSFLREILRRSGLLTQRADDFQFIHQTVGEFLAARHLVTDAPRSQEVFHDLFERWTPPRVWEKPDWDDSYSRFIVAAWPDKPRLTQALDRLATDGGLAGCRFIASLTIDMAVPAPSVVARATATLTALAEDTAVDFPVRREACEVLAQLGDGRGADLLAALAADPALNPVSRRHAAEALTRLGDGRGADLLAVLAADPALDNLSRLWAAQALARLGDSRSTDLLAPIAIGRSYDARHREDAVKALARLGDSRSVEVLALLADDLTLGARARRLSAQTMVRLGDPRGIDLLAAQATDPALDTDERREAIEALTQLDDARGADLLAARAADPALARAEAVWHLVGVDDGRGADLLAALAADPQVSASARHKAAWHLAKVNDYRGADLLAAVAADPRLSLESRLETVEGLGGLASPRWSGGLGALPTQGARGQAVTSVPRRPDRRAAELLAALATGPSVDYEVRSAAAWELARMDDRRG